jgi:hypothetical protein
VLLDLARDRLLGRHLAGALLLQLVVEGVDLLGGHLRDLRRHLLLDQLVGAETALLGLEGQQALLDEPAQRTLENRVALLLELLLHLLPLQVELLELLGRGGLHLRHRDLLAGDDRHLVGGCRSGGGRGGSLGAAGEHPAEGEQERCGEQQQEGAASRRRLALRFIHCDDSPCGAPRSGE